MPVIPELDSGIQSFILPDLKGFSNEGRSPDSEIHRFKTRNTIVLNRYTRAMRKFLFIILFFVFTILTANANGSDFSARAAVERDEVFMGEPFAFQIQVSGSENPEQPDLSFLTDFQVNFNGGSRNSSSSVTIINGKVTRNVREGYVFSWQLTPLRTGNLVIPSIRVTSGGKSDSTSPIVISVTKPVETDDFKLRLLPSKQECYAGEPVMLTVKWYIGKNVQNFHFNLPFLEGGDFLFSDIDVDIQSGKNLYRIPLGSREAIAEEAKERFEGRDYLTLTFKIGLIPKTPGNIVLEGSTVSFSALSGYDSRRSGDPFSDLFDDDFFGMSRRGVYRNMVIPSNSPVLKVKELPLRGRPDDFSGYVGKYEIETEAEPTVMNVGDPVTLTISIKGPELLEHVELPYLNKQKELAFHFKIPPEMAAGRISGNEKIFTQTIRPLNSNVKQIPSLRIPFFDTESGEYRYAESRPVDITVNDTRVVTLLDAEGSSIAGPAGNEIESLRKGIAFNYEDMSVIEKKRLNPLSWLESMPVLLTIILMPLLYLTLMPVVFLYRKGRSNPLKIKARKNYNHLVQLLESTKKTEISSDLHIRVLNAFREYLGARLGMTSGAITFRDVEERLEEINIDKELIQRLKRLFDTCEAKSYAGCLQASNDPSLLKDGLMLAKDLERSLKQKLNSGGRNGRS